MDKTDSKTARAELLDDGRIMRLVLDAGKGNVIGMRVIADLGELLEQARTTKSLRALVLDHEGDHFCFGASVDEHVPGKAEEMLPQFHDLAKDLLQLSIPVVCAVRGMCLGGGLEVACLADRIFVSPNAKLGQPEMMLGVFAPIGSALLPRRIGSMPAADLLLSGRIVKAEEAREMGLVSEIVDDPSEAALAWVREHLLPKSASSLRFAAMAARRAWADDFLVDLEHLEAVYMEDLMATHDAVEGINAFLEKRDPEWKDA